MAGMHSVFSNITSFGIIALTTSFLAMSVSARPVAVTQKDSGNRTKALVPPTPSAPHRYLSGDPSDFAQRRGYQLYKNGKPYYANGFNAYWLMYIASIPEQKQYVPQFLQQAQQLGLTVARTWAFFDGSGWHALQSSPGVFDENTFQALDYVIATAGSMGIQLHFTFTNNWQDFGGKPTYLDWARAAGSSLPDDDTAFFVDPNCRQFYKDYVTAIITRTNTVTGVTYRDDPTIFGWELINEPRINSDPSGNVLQAWIEEMASHVKSLDSNHLLSIGAEGFYGPSSPGRQRLNAESWMTNVGTDFIRNNQAPGIDIASVHAYSNSRYSAQSWSGQLKYYKEWIQGHIRDCRSTLKMPLLVGEFGPNPVSGPFGDITSKDDVYNITYVCMLAAAKAGQPGAVAMLWQLLPEGLSSWNDGLGVIIDSNTPTLAIIRTQSQALASLG